MKAPSRKKFPKPFIGSELVLDRMAEKRTDEAWVAKKAANRKTRYLLFADLSLAVNSNEDHSRTDIRWHTYEDLLSLKVTIGEAILLGCRKDGQAIFCVSLRKDQAQTIPGGYEGLKPLVDLRSLAVQGVLTPEELSLAGMARALAAWHISSSHCGRCGSHTLMHDAGWRRECWACGQEFYPRSDPAVIVLITDGQRCLLGHHKRYTHKFYSTLAGFVEPGEDFETCVRREMREETGIEIGKVKYMASQPWPFPHLTMVGCWAEALTTDLTLEEVELYDARWFTRDEVKLMMKGEHPEGITVPGPHSIAYALIRSFVEAK